MGAVAGVGFCADAMETKKKIAAENENREQGREAHRESVLQKATAPFVFARAPLEVAASGLFADALSCSS